MAPSKKRSCFFVTPIGSEGSNERKRADDILELVLRPISADFLTIVRADEVDEPGTITTDIVKRLHSNDLVIADLTGNNPNVMYEVGLRHCFNLPIVHLAQDGQKPPFDLSAERIVFFDLGDVRSVEMAKKKIGRACHAALDASPYKSPVVRALELESLFAASTEMPIPRSLIEKLDALEATLDDVSGEISSLTFQIDSGISAGYSGADYHLEERVAELVRLFDGVGPTDIARFAEYLRKK